MVKYGQSPNNLCWPWMNPSPHYVQSGPGDMKTNTNDGYKSDTHALPYNMKLWFQYINMVRLVRIRYTHIQLQQSNIHNCHSFTLTSSVVLIKISEQPFGGLSLNITSNIPNSTCSSLSINNSFTCGKWKYLPVNAMKHRTANWFIIKIFL